MEKTGEVAVTRSPCEICGEPATSVSGDRSRCDTHRLAPVGEKQSADSDRRKLSSFTDPVEAPHG